MIYVCLQGNVHLYPKPINDDKQGLNQKKSKEIVFSDTRSQIWRELKLNDKCNIIVRVYILRAHNLHPSDINGLSDPYVEILFGKSRRISDHKNYIPKTLNPIFGRYIMR